MDTFFHTSLLGFGHFGYVIVFLVAIFESVPLVGLFIPGMLVVIAGGFMVRLGILDIGGVIVVASIGAMLGDVIGYIIGKKYGLSFFDRYGKFFFLHTERFEKIRSLMSRHTGKSLIFGRFNSFTRSFTPFVAGSSSVSFVRFLWFNIVGGILWAIVFVLAGYIFGEGYKTVSRYIGGFITIAIFLSVGIVYAYRFINKRKRIFSKYHIYVLAVNILSLYVFAKIVEDVNAGEAITRLDVFMNGKMALLQNPLLNQIMIFITDIASPLNLSIMSALLLVALVIKKKWYYVVLFFGGMTGGVLLELLFKFLIQKERPLNALIEVSGYSFPSGHATTAILFFVILLYTGRGMIRNSFVRVLWYALMIGAFLSVGFSRVYLNVHWQSDVVAGFALGIFWLTLLVLIIKSAIAVGHRLFRE